jgi:hypothetical protein
MRLAMFGTLVALLSGCASEATIRSFPRFTESQNEWLQSHCRVSFIDEFAVDTKLADAKKNLDADIVERLASSQTAVQLVGYRCSVSVPPEVSKGEDSSSCE